MSERPSLVPESGKPITEAHLMAALILLAQIMEEHGDVYAPLFERLEAELIEMRRQRGNTPADRAKRLLEAYAEGVDAYTLAGGTKAIR
jgi:hypothetical protein